MNEALRLKLSEIWFTALHLVFWGSIAFLGCGIIWNNLTETRVRTDQIWFPPEYRILNKVDSKLVNSFNFRPTLPTVSVGVEEFRDTFRNADIVVSLKKSDHHNQYPKIAEVSYMAAQNGVVYMASAVFYESWSDKVSWEFPNTIRHEGFISSWATAFAVIFFIMCIILYFVDGEIFNRMAIIDIAQEIWNGYKKGKKKNAG